MSDLPTAEEVLENVGRTKKLIVGVFSQGSGRDLLKEWERIYIKGRLYDDSDRFTVYNIAQRDFVLEILEAVGNNHE